MRLALLGWLLGLAIAAPLAAQDLPELSGRVVDGAELLPPGEEAQIAAKLEALERNTSRQLVVVTIPDLQGYSPEDFGFALGERWKIGNQEADNGAILLVAPKERRVRIEVGDGLEGILPDAMAWIIIRDRITPRFKAGDYPGGIGAGVDGIVEQLQAPLEVAEQRAQAAAEQRRQAYRSANGNRARGGGDSIMPLMVLGVILFFFVLPALFGRGRYGRRYRSRRGGMGPVIIWGGGSGWGGGGWSGGGGGGFGGGLGGGGFSGGGGSFGGGGASGSW